MPTYLTDDEGTNGFVDVYRPSEEAVIIGRQGVAVGAKVLWLRLSVSSDETRRIAEDAGLTVVMDTCMGAAHRQLGLGPLTPSA